MINISQRLLSVKPSATLMAFQKATELKAQGKTILSLSAGEPDFPTPLWICEETFEAVRQGETRYTPIGGSTKLKQVIRQKFKQENNLDFKLEEIIACSGGKQVIFNALLATINPDDEIIIPAPYWVSYLDIVEIAEGKPIIIPCSQHQNFKITPEQLEKAITTRTKWFILNSPNNPTGSVYSKHELQELAKVLINHPQVMILSDDIYEHILFTTNPFYTLAQIEPRLKSRILTMNGVSKSYSMTGWRLGYAAGPEWLIKAMTDLQSHSTSNPSSLSQAGAISALTGPQDFLKEWRQSFIERRNQVVKALSLIPGIECLTPEGAFYVYPCCEGILGKKTPSGSILNNDEEISHYLLESVGVSVVHGAAFGLSPYFRISYATDSKVLEKACYLIAEGIRALS